MGRLLSLVSKWRLKCKSDRAILGHIIKNCVIEWVFLCQIKWQSKQRVKCKQKRQKGEEESAKQNPNNNKEE